jgi:hypothetical protein
MSENIIDFDEARESRGMKRCPSCNSTKVSAIMYGYPSSEYFENLRDDVVLGGCVVSEDAAEWQCNACGRPF